MRLYCTSHKNLIVGLVLFSYPESSAVHRFLLSLTDIEMLLRLRGYSSRLPVVIRKRHVSFIPRCLFNCVVLTWAVFPPPYFLYYHSCFYSYLIAYFAFNCLYTFVVYFFTINEMEWIFLPTGLLIDFSRSHSLRWQSDARFLYDSCTSRVSVKGYVPVL